MFCLCRGWFCGLPWQTVCAWEEFWNVNLSLWQKRLEMWICAYDKRVLKSEFELMTEDFCAFELMQKFWNVNLSLWQKVLKREFDSFEMCIWAYDKRGFKCEFELMTEEFWNVNFSLWKVNWSLWQKSFDVHLSLCRSFEMCIWAYDKRGLKCEFEHMTKEVEMWICTCDCEFALMTSFEKWISAYDRRVWTYAEVLKFEFELMTKSFDTWIWAYDKRVNFSLWKVNLSLVLKCAIELMHKFWKVHLSLWQVFWNVNLRLWQKSFETWIWAYDKRGLKWELELMTREVWNASWSLWQKSFEMWISAYDRRLETWIWA